MKSNYLKTRDSFKSMKIKVTQNQPLYRYQLNETFEINLKSTIRGYLKISLK